MTLIIFLQMKSCRYQRALVSSSHLPHLRYRDVGKALLFLPNLLRGFNVVIMSSGFGAAIGVAEAVGVTVREAEMLETMGERVALFLTAIVLFVTFFSAANLLVQRLARLSR